jgi:hypothetical protein
MKVEHFTFMCKFTYIILGFQKVTDEAVFSLAHAIF